MKAFLMFPDSDFDPGVPLPPETEVLTEDLELGALLNTMAQGDALLYGIARSALGQGLEDPRTIRYRQAILGDCLGSPAVIRALFDLTLITIREEKRAYGWGAGSPTSVLHRSVAVMEVFSRRLRELRDLVGQNASAFSSEGFTRLNRMLADELDDAYFEEIDAHLKTLRFRRGVVVSAGLGAGNKGARYVLRRPFADRPGRIGRLLQARSTHSLTIPDRDESGFNALTELRGRGINLVADALARSCDHTLSFFTMLRDELAFYVGALNLSDALAGLGMPVVFPQPAPADGPVFAAAGLYDPCLSLIARSAVVGNDVDLGERTLLIVTGANQGGKSTFLRSVGTAHLMMQCGLFVPATAFRSSLRRGVFTHFRREEDASLSSGKLDEELSRMSELSDQLKPGSLLLCNESFASTNEREGSEIARQVTRAAVTAGVTVFFVTHLYDFASSMRRERGEGALFLRAERAANGTRSFRLSEGPPLPTSYGQDVFAKVFGVSVPS